MRLLIGLVAFLAWSGGSAYWYVCKVKGLCPEEMAPSTELLAETEELSEGFTNEAEENDLENGGVGDDSQNDALILAEEVVADDGEQEVPGSETSEDDDRSDTSSPTADDVDHPAIDDLPDKYTILFAYAKPIISNQDEADEYMQEVATFLSNNPNAKVKVIGYTDDTAAKHKNKELGLKRANSIADLLEGQGVPRDKIDVKSMGEADPVATNETPAGRKRNRRVEITVQSH